GPLGGGEQCGGHGGESDQGGDGAHGHDSMQVERRPGFGVRSKQGPGHLPGTTPDGTPMPHSILIIDDEEPIAWALRRAFERESYRVAVAATAEDGLAKARKDRPDVVFLDVRLPGMDGLTALAELKKVAPAAAVIVITAHGNLNTAVKAVGGGAFD